MLKSFKSFMEESWSADKYHRAIHTGELPKIKKSAASAKNAKPVKTYDELHQEVKNIPYATGGKE